MSGIVTMEILNCLTVSKNKIKVYNSDTTIIDLVSFGNSIVISISEPNYGDNLFLDIQVVKKKDNCPREYLIDMPIWVNFEVLSSHIIESSFECTESRKILIVPDGMLEWKLRISKPKGITIPLSNIIKMREGEK